MDKIGYSGANGLRENPLISPRRNMWQVTIASASVLIILSLCHSADSVQQEKPEGQTNIRTDVCHLDDVPTESKVRQYNRNIDRTWVAKIISRELPRQSYGWGVPIKPTVVLAGSGFDQSRINPNNLAVKIYPNIIINVSAIIHLDHKENVPYNYACLKLSAPTPEHIKLIPIAASGVQFELGTVCLNLRKSYGSHIVTVVKSNNRTVSIDTRSFALGAGIGILVCEKDRGRYGSVVASVVAKSHTCRRSTGCTTVFEHIGNKCSSIDLLIAQTINYADDFLSQYNEIWFSN